MATKQVQEDWFEDSLGLFVNPDNVAGFQCVDTVKHYAMAIFGNVPWKISTRAGHAEDMFHGANPEYFDKITNDPKNPNQLPQRGDCIFWDGTEDNPYGHAAVCADASVEGASVHEQDGFLQIPISKAFRPWYLAGTGMVLGWTRPRAEKMVGVYLRPAAGDIVEISEDVLHGIDISGWQKGIDLDAVPADFVIIKATGGKSFVSNSVHEQYADAKHHGKRKGLYHFAHENGFQGSAVDEANHFLATTKDYWDGATVPVLDWEGDNVSDTGWAKDWLDHVTDKLGGIKPLIYMNLNTANSYDWDTVQDAGYALWLAQYPSSAHQGYGPLANLQEADGWDTVLWQYSQSGRLPGYGGNLDLNIFYGDAKAWVALAGGKAIKPKVPTVPRPPASGKGRWVIVEAGDSLSTIADQFDSTTNAIAAANGIANVNLIYPGQKLLIPSGGSATANTAGGKYTVKAGDSLSAIAARYGTTWQAIAKASGIANPDVIYPGQVLTIPGGKAPAKAKSYTVRAGDSLSSIAVRNGTTWQALAQLNGLSNPDVIYPGQVLKISGTARPAAQRSHTVRAGESLLVIAARNGTTWQALAQLNGLSNPNVIYPGQKIRLP